MLFSPQILTRPPIVPAAAGSWNVIKTISLPLDTGGYGGETIVQRYAAGALSHAGSKIRFRFVPTSAQGSNLDITAAYVGHAAAAGDPYDFETTPTQILVGASGSFTLTDGGPSVVCDDTTFALDISKTLLVSFQAAGFPNGGIRYVAADANGELYQKTGADAATVNKSGYSDTGTYYVIIDQIEAFY